MELREHQQKALDLITQAFKQGTKRVVLGAPCSFGKTVLASYMMQGAQKKGKSAMFICDRIKLIDQTIKTFRKDKITFGVIQSNHPLENEAKSIQIASSQTLSRRVEKMFLDYDLIIVDECHIQYKKTMDFLKQCTKAKIVGLSATPFSKGMGNFYQKLIVPITPRELQEKQFLVPVKYYVGKSVSLTNIRTQVTQTGTSDYNPYDLGVLYENNDKLTGHIVNNWIEYGENKQTIAFCSSIKHSKYLVEKFKERGIPAEHIDGYMDVKQRKKLYEGHDQGKFKILSCSKLLNTGYDAPQVACLIDCKPTKSLVSYAQTYGRIFRICDDKPYAIVLDHAQNVKKHGMAEDVVPIKLHNTVERYREKNQVKKKEKKAITCPKCQALFHAPKCHCGYALPETKKIEHTDEMLEQMTLKDMPKYDRETAERWYNQLKTLQEIRGYKTGWSEVMFKKKFGTYPPKNLKYVMVSRLSDEVRGFVTNQLIRYQKGKKSKNKGE